MLKLLTTIMDEACATLIERIRELTLHHELFPGEDVDKPVSIIRGIHLRLKVCHSVPSDLTMMIVLNIFKTAACLEFAQTFATIDSRQLGITEISGVRIDLTHIMRVASENYKSFLGSGK